MSERAALRLLARNLKKSFPLPDGGRLEILRGVNLSADEAEAVAVMGVSGSGKTTLLHILAGIETPDEGEVVIDGVRAGLIFQLHHLLPELNALENVALAGRLNGRARGEAFEEAGRLLDEVGLGSRATHLPSEMSGGEVARVAIARALAADPRVILADEPTGNLDESTSETIQALLFDRVRAHRKTLVIVTHDSRVAARADRTVHLAYGVLGS
jgi:predicted ABC-type transport system involved in lysophospholipase L1 biosynthesis ATPase subunit